jgi:DNA repair protein RecO (recombination protein O)
VSRHLVYAALALRVRASFESNREAFFLTAEEGIVRASVYGGPKSRLRSYVAPFHEGTLWVYHDPVRDSRKVTDFDVRLWRPGLRERYERSAAASAIAETVLAAQGGGGSWDQGLALTGAALDGLEAADEATVSRIFTHFLWNWADFMGLRPDIRRCSVCACEVPPDAVLWYTPDDGALRCDACGGMAWGRAAGYYGAQAVALGGGARRWLVTAGSRDPAVLSRYTMDTLSARQARSFLTALLTEALGRRPSAWDGWD